MAHRLVHVPNSDTCIYKDKETDVSIKTNKVFKPDIEQADLILI
jgi:hypothetical protein